MNQRNEYTTSWIPEKFAHIGKFLKLKNETGEWEDGWLVIEVGSKLPSKVVEERKNDYRKQREASDI